MTKMNKVDDYYKRRFEEKYCGKFTKSDLEEKIAQLSPEEKQKLLYGEWKQNG